MRDYFSVGEVSKMTGFTINALRHYDKIGLCTPTYVDKVTKYRYYRESQLFLFDIIRFAKDINMPLEELKEIFDTNSMESFKDFLDAMRERMSAQIEQIEAHIADLDNVKAQVARAEFLVNTDGFYQRDIEERTVVTSPILPSTVNNYYVKEVAALESEVIDKNLTPLFESGTIYQYQNDKGGYKPLLMYKTVLLDYDTDSDSLTTIPGGTYLCVNYDISNRERAFQLMESEILRLGYVNAAVIECRLMNDIFHPEKQHLELQVFVGEN